ncbi:DMT family transporter [Pseudothermotoga sp.]|nr:DMT family transporter [Pseudothermotoga sp.]MCX7812363.1 DMT family transporter [Pseudothermotoga sp.]MDW8139433.1 DMT family transporter [Pseudothermotoga sp.]
MNRKIAILFLIITAILWSLGGLLIKLVNWNPIAIAAGRSIISALLMLAYVRKPKFNWSRDQILAALFYFGTVTLFVTANKFTTAANAILLQYGAPVYVAIFAPLILKEKTKTADWIAIAFALFGMTLFFFDELEVKNLFGIVIAVASGVSFALYIIFMRKQKDASPIDSTLLGNILTALVGLPFIFSQSFEFQNVLGIVLLGTVQLGLSYILYSIAIKYVEALEAILIPIIEPILNPIWVFLAFGEKPGSWALLGGIIVLSSVTLRYSVPLLVRNFNTTK